jgi:hypothetical protein
MAENRFLAFLKSRSWSGNERDFVGDATLDPTLPDPKSWRELESYLVNYNPVEGTLPAAKSVWQIYSAEQPGVARWARPHILGAGSNTRRGKTV